MVKLGSKILHFESLPSTNDKAREMAQSGADEGIAIIASQQTAGRGRHGRSWDSPPGHGLYVSLILRPSIEPADFSVITLAAAVATHETLTQVYRISADIKWPNDVLARGRKICGILVESAIESGKLLYAVMGIGVNLGQPDFPEELKQSATSLFIESAHRVAPTDFFERLVIPLDEWYRKAIADPAAVIARWEAVSTYARDCPVRVEAADSIIEGTTRGLTEKGALIIELANGEIREIVSGELKLRKG